MANPPQRSQQVPQHVTALLSHLTSRPGVQSTLILARKDGSIIQSTGLLAPPENGTTTPRSNPNAQITTEQPLTQPTDPSSPSSPTQPSPSTYQPSQAETLAAHIFNFVSSASALGISLSRPSLKNDERGPVSMEAGYNSAVNGTSTPREEVDGNAERDEDDEVKLLRMRTRKHEIVVVPDRKYLLCVVHDANSASGGSGAGGPRSR